MAAKIVVEVVARFDTAGGLTPLWMGWEDGRRFGIDRVLDVRRAASLKAGGVGIRYTVRISGKERYLWFEDMANIWFVEG